MVSVNRLVRRTIQRWRGDPWPISFATQLFANYSVGDDITHVRLSPNGRSVTSTAQLIGGFNNPLPLAVGPGGLLFVGEFSGNKVTALHPVSLGCWTARTPAPLAILDAGGAGVNEKLYMVAGKIPSAHLSSLYVYDPARDAWTQGPDLPGPRVENPGVTALDGKLYVFGGRIRNADGSVQDGTLDLVEMYDPVTDTWVARARMPSGRRAMVVGTLNGRAQVMGGERAAGGKTFPQNEEYDPAADTWRTLTAMQTPRHGTGRRPLPSVRQSTSQAGAPRLRPRWRPSASDKMVLITVLENTVYRHLYDRGIVWKHQYRRDHVRHGLGLAHLRG